MSTTKTAPKKSAAKSAEGGLTAYCMKTKEKNVPMVNAVIDVANGRYIAKGEDADGNKMTSIMNEQKAKDAVAAGHAKRGSGWPKK